MSQSLTCQEISFDSQSSNNILIKQNMSDQLIKYINTQNSIIDYILDKAIERIQMKYYDKKNLKVIPQQISDSLTQALSQINIKVEKLKPRQIESDQEFAKVEIDTWMNISHQKLIKTNKQNVISQQSLKSINEIIRMKPIRFKQIQFKINNKILKTIKHLMQIQQMKIQNNYQRIRKEEARQNTLQVEQLQIQKEKENQQQNEFYNSIQHKGSKTDFTYDFDGKIMVINPINIKNLPQSQLQVNYSISERQLITQRMNLANPPLQQKTFDYKQKKKFQFKLNVQQPKFLNNTDFSWKDFQIQPGVQIACDEQVFTSQIKKSTQNKLTKTEYNKLYESQNVQANITHQIKQSMNKKIIQEQIKEEDDLKPVLDKKSIRISKNGQIRIEKQVEELINNETTKQEQLRLKKYLQNQQQDKQKIYLDPVDEFNQKLMDGTPVPKTQINAQNKGFQTQRNLKNFKINQRIRVKKQIQYPTIN